jgi:import receptor subunit TOM20
MFGLVADKDFEEGEVLYTETPLISALYPLLEVKALHTSRLIVQVELKYTCFLFFLIGHAL